MSNQCMPARARIARPRSRPKPMRNPWLDLEPIGKDPRWLTGNMEWVRVSEMDDDHLLNLERMLLGQGRNDSQARKVLHLRWYDVIRGEVNRRGLTPLNAHPNALKRQLEKIFSTLKTQKEALDVSMDARSDSPSRPLVESRVQSRRGIQP